MIKKCINCKEYKKHNAKGLCKKCYDTSDEYKMKRNFRRLGKRKVVSQKGRIKPRKRINEILRKIKRTGGLTDSKKTIIEDIKEIQNEMRSM